MLRPAIYRITISVTYSILLVGDQLDAQFFYIISLFQPSTCFEQTRAHHQEVNCINTASGIVTLCKWPSGMQIEQELDLHTGRLHTGVTIPDAVLIQFTSWWWARVCSKHVEDWNKRITRVAQKVMSHFFFSRKLFTQNVWNSRTV